MRDRTLTNLIDDVRKAADIEYATDRFPDSEITEYINQSIIRLYTLLDKMDSQYYWAEASFATENGVSKYDLPKDFHTLKGVNISVSSGTTIRARRYTPEEAHVLENGGSWANYGYPIFYRLQGKSIVFKPAPTGQYTVTLEYTPIPQRLAGPQEAFDGIAGYERWVVLDAAMKCKMKDDLDPTLLAAEKADIEEWIASIANQRDVGATETIQDVQSIDNLPFIKDFWV